MTSHQQFTLWELEAMLDRHGADETIQLLIETIKHRASSYYRQSRGEASELGDYWSALAQRIEQALECDLVSAAG